MNLLHTRPPPGLCPSPLRDTTRDFPWRLAGPSHGGPLLNLFLRLSPEENNMGTDRRNTAVRIFPHFPAFSRLIAFSHILSTFSTHNFRIFYSSRSLFPLRIARGVRSHGVLLLDPLHPLKLSPEGKYYTEAGIPF